MTSRPAQQPSLPIPEQGRRRVWCRACGRELHDPDARFRGYGADCDPANRTRCRRPDDIDQDTIPGT
ncbi:DUF6011 domain-containing protein [Streptomyces platensis]|uniref:DUF6011 domain-containing protein n=1 Tax=Streptomyces platensis TaxID=58346 RepID=UPI00368CAC58